MYVSYMLSRMQYTSRLSEDVYVHIAGLLNELTVLRPSGHKLDHFH